MAGIKANHIVVPFDFSDACLEAVKQAVDWCSLDGTVTVVHALDEFFPAHPSETYPALIKEKYCVLCKRKLTAVLSDAGITHECIRVRVVIGRVGAELIRVIEQAKADLVVIPSHCRKGLSRVWLGSVAEYVTRRAACPVMILKHGDDGSLQSLSEIANILVPFDFSNACIDAVKDALAIAGDNAQIDILHVLTEFYPIPMRTPEGWLENKYFARARIEMRDALTDSGIQEENTRLHVVYGDAGREITKFAAAQDIDLLVMPSHRRGGFQRLVVGSVAERVTRCSPRPVLIMKSPDMMDDFQFKPVSTEKSS